MTRTHRIAYAPAESPPQDRITSHFRVAEFAQHARHGFESEPYPARWVNSRLRPLCELLEQIREVCGGRAVRVTSGYRSPAYNRVIKGARASQHVQGRAADIVVAGLSARRVHDLVLAAYRRGELPALGGLGSYAGFTHVDVRPSQRLAHWRG